MEETPCTTKSTRHLDVNYNEPTRFTGRSIENGLPVTKPLDNLEELKAWKFNDSHDKGQSFSIALVPFHGKYSADSQPKTLVCHDMGGGYLDDRFVQGTLCEDDKWYYMAYWDVVDTFVYFSHHFVTIPPVGWINCAHTNGVSVLGTFITEGDTGIERCKEIFSSDSTWKLVADALVNIAKYYKFEGWLLNIENSIESQNMDRLKDFVKYLTEEMHRAVAGSQVIWYDSVTVDGVLAWQNELNAENQPFFDRCDGIFLNYLWDENRLQKSAELAKVMSRVTDVYVGVDVFGRGSYGGGRMNTFAAVEVSSRHSLSAAIFAPGWVMENLESKDFESNQSKFWKALAPYCKYRAVDIPCSYFYTDFHPGFELHRDSRFLHLSRQSLLPHMSSHALMPVPVASRPHVTIDSACHDRLFSKARMKDESNEGGYFQLNYVTDPSKNPFVCIGTCVGETFSLPDIVYTLSGEKFEILNFSRIPTYCERIVKEDKEDIPADDDGIEILLDDVTWTKAADCGLLFSATLCFKGIYESHPVIVSTEDKCGIKQLGIAYCDKYRVHNFPLPDPPVSGNGEFGIIAQQTSRYSPESGSNRLKWSELVVTYGEKSAAGTCRLQW